MTLSDTIQAVVGIVGAPAAIGASIIVYFRWAQAIATKRYGATALLATLGVLLATDAAVKLGFFGDKAGLSVYPAFSKAYRTDLGVPLDGGTAITNTKDEGVYQGTFEHGRIIWLNDFPAVVYSLHYDDYSYKVYNENPVTYPSCYSNQKCLRTKLLTPIGEEPPPGSAAELLMNNQHERDVQGSVDWQCYLDGDKVFVQRFAGGMIVGPLRATKDEGGLAAIALVLIYDKTSKSPLNGTFESPGIPGGPPPCAQVF